MKPAVILVATIAIAAAAGTAVSFAQRPPPPSAHHPSPSPNVVDTPPANQPAVAFGFTVAADLATHTHHLVLFGGVGNFEGTWLWDGAAWARAHPATSPKGRYGASSAFDPLIGDVMLFGGTLETGQAAGDTWAWDGRNWQELNAGRGGPAGGAGSEMAWDPTSSELVLVTRSADGRGGGQTWTWNGAHWVRDVAGAVGTPDSSILIAFDPLSKSLMAEGCCLAQSSTAPATQPGTWRWNGSAWIPVVTTVHPLDGSSMEEDPALQRLVLCGCDLGGGQGPEMWVWNGRDWMAGLYPRPPIAPEALVVDPADSQFLILGSAIAGADALTQTVEVWTVRGTQWLRLGVGIASG